MPFFGTLSRKNLAELDPRLQRLFNFVIQHWDCQVIDGARTIEEQRKNVAKGVSQTMDSRHLPDPITGKAMAGDVMPFPYDWDKIQKGLDAIKRADGGMQIAEVYAFCGYVQGVADALGIPLRSGYDWNTNRQFEDTTFIDLPHHEIPKGL